MRVSETAALKNHDASLREPQVQVEDAPSPMTQALIELEETSGSALIATLEDMGMALSGRFKDLQQADLKERLEQRQQALLRMVQRMQEQADGIPTQLTQPHSGSSLGQQLLGVAVLLLAEKPNSKRRKALSEKLAELMSEQGWEISLFGMLELGQVSKGALAQINRLFQQAMDEEVTSLAEWFQRIMNWPDRRQRLKVLLRMMAFELSACVVGSQQQRLAGVLVRLRRLLVFLGLEQECLRIESACEMASGTLLPFLIEMTNESWLFDEWLAPRLAQRAASVRLYNRLLQHLDALFSLMPEACFNDEDQREQILAVLRGMKGDRAIT
ncbi:TyeA family type III secretion system gatekeeper subunit [Pantoea stewartii]|uniref:SepL/TyeA/HrpJ family type III secretion system gatekeeper n=1 Tax=Pantoea stewartii subsp. stewartii DC283 TaxID=660596 RepID=H3RKV1_PANSE|nr:TyeA family type III secretion system gatekeeper subunit [Pantoea stewartii]ARF52289.1 SepL/TyeA/HrpJ family type III secretion system gatekeeper [Pantoea stewartii subsp. stewartii DC283]EHT97946.1 type III secretion system apparatus protein [Pantoea stewartii subsp. stewartii DC283]KAB0556769.1 TyeA family type III secretion system gatekeeper subunit [Pantoea stewartii subsp. stewartii]